MVMTETKFLKSLLALESFIEVMSWGFLLWFLIRDRHGNSSDSYFISLLDQLNAVSTDFKIKEKRYSV